MQFRAEHVFPAVTLAEFEKLFLDEPFNEALCRDVAIERHLQRHETIDGRLIRDVQVFPDRQVPGPIAKVTGGGKVGYVEHLEYVWGSYAGTFTCTPTVLADRVRTEGRFQLEARGDGVARLVFGSVDVRVFGVGGIIERFIVADVERSYQDAAAFTERTLAARR